MNIADFFRRYRKPEIWNPSAKDIPLPIKAISQNMIYPIGSIPGRPEAHASNIIQGICEKDKIELYCAWFCGTREGHLDVAVMFSKISYKPHEKLEDIKFEYSKPVVIADMPDRACGNPVLFLDQERILYLWYAAFYPRGSPINDRQLYLQKSIDLGATWSKPELFSDRAGLWVRNNMVVLQSGKWLLPINDEATMVPEFNTLWSSRFVWSVDKGKSWEFGPLYSCKRGMIQPSVVQFPSGELYCVNRSRNGNIMAITSQDEGKTWSEAKSIGLPNPNSNVVQWLRENGDLVLIYNPTKKGRSPISIAISKDNGQTWTRILDLQIKIGEFSYPCIWETPDKLIHITYTYRRKTIAHDIVQF